MLHTFAVSSQKGGVGKTTTALHLAFSFAAQGKRVLIVDADPQGGIIYGIDSDLNGGRLPGLYQVYCGDAELFELARSTGIEGIEIIGCGIENSSEEIEKLDEASKVVGLLKAAVQNAADQYDIVLLDCPPGMGHVTKSAFVSANSVIIPVQCEPLSLRTLPQVLRTLIEIKKQYNTSVKIAGILLTMHETRVALSQHIVDQVRRTFDPKFVFETVIPRDPNLNYAFSGSSFYRAILKYESERQSPGIRAYSLLSGEIVRKVLDASQPNNPRS